MTDVREWLDSIGLGQYAEAFEQNDVEWVTLPELDHDLLKEIGITSIGHRVALLKAIKNRASDDASPTQDEVHTVAQREGSGEAERRQLTVVFADMVGSTELSQALDPEDLREVNRIYQDACAAAIEAYGGYVARYMGDGVLAYFGYPQAHEDDAERAVRSGLKLIEDIAALETKTELAIRVGIATGDVVVGDIIGKGAAQENAVVGETPNLAARLQGSSDKNDLVISERTYRLIAGFFDCEARGYQSYKGLKAPVPSWRVIDERAAASRFEAQHQRRMTPLVGRDTELQFLLDRWEQAKGGEGQVVLLSAEAGLGKSRLTEELRRRLADERHRLLRFQCSPHHLQSAFYPFVSALERDARFERGDTPDQKLSKLHALVGEHGADEVLPLFASLLSLPAQGSPIDLSQAGAHQRLLEAMAAQVVTVSHGTPALLIFEDVHWSDPSSLEALGLVIDELRNSKVLGIVTFRPEFKAPWTDRAHVTTQEVTPLGQRHIEQMIQVLATSTMSRHVLDTIVMRTDGIPLFIEELTQAVLEGDYARGSETRTDGRRTTELAIPATLQDSLVARLDRLGRAKEVAQLGALIGRVFSERLVGAVLPLTPAALGNALGQLVHSGLAFKRQTLDGAVFEFKHALVQDAAASTVLRERRRALHAEIANALESMFPETVESEPELLAYHFGAAGLPEKSLDYRQLAAEKARRRFANREASEHFAGALELLTALPESDARLRREAALQAGLGMTLTATKGQIAPEVGVAFRRARAICQQIADVDQEFAVLRGLWLHYQIGSRLREAGEIGEELLAIATSQGRSDYSIEAHRALGQNALWRGQYSRARKCFERVLDLYDSEAHAKNLHLFGQDPRALSSTMLAAALWSLGFPDAARHHLEDGLAFAAKVNHPYSSCVAGIMAMFTFALLRDWKRSGIEAERTIQIAGEHGLPFFRALATCYAGLAEVMQGTQESGFAKLKRGFEMYPGSKEAWWNYALVTACVEMRRYSEAEVALGEAFEMMQATGDALVLAGCHVLKAQVFLEDESGVANVELALMQALKIARTQEAMSWELRAATALAGLWFGQGDSPKAKGLLVPIYAFFAEGFGTPDITEAKALLDKC